MNIDEAIMEFENRRGKKYSHGDLQKIRAVVAELGLSQFDIQGDGADSAFVYDIGKVLHIHPTMLVAGTPYKDSFNRGPEPYVKFPHFFQLEGFSRDGAAMHEKGGVTEVFCATSFTWVPVSTECLCGQVHQLES